MTFQLICYTLLLHINTLFALISLENNVEIRSSLFVSKPLHVKEGEPIKTREVFDAENCQLLCVHEPLCYLVNFKRQPEAKSKLRRCKLFKLSSFGTILPSQQFDLYQKIVELSSCSHAKALGYANSKHYVIDPDGPHGDAEPFQVYCNMTSLNGVGVTVISHDSEARTLVKGYEPKGSYRRDVVYDGISDIQQLRALTAISAKCRQWISYDCYGATINIWRGDNSVAWLVSSDGNRLNYWGGATPGSYRCACGVNGTCVAGGMCNCDTNKEVWATDAGWLVYKDDLPITELRFGDTGNGGEKAYHVLSQLQCYGFE